MQTTSTVTSLDRIHHHKSQLPDSMYLLHCQCIGLHYTQVIVSSPVIKAMALMLYIFLLCIAHIIIFVVQANWPFNTIQCVPYNIQQQPPCITPQCQAKRRLWRRHACSSIAWSQQPSDVAQSHSHAHGRIIISSTPLMYGHTAWSGVETSCMV